MTSSGRLLSSFQKSHVSRAQSPPRQLARFCEYTLHTSAVPFLRCSFPKGCPISHHEPWRSLYLRGNPQRWLRAVRLSSTHSFPTLISLFALRRSEYIRFYHLRTYDVSRDPSWWKILDSLIFPLCHSASMHLCRSYLRWKNEVEPGLKTLRLR